MHVQKITIFSALLATALTWHASGPAGAGQFCPRISGAIGHANVAPAGVAAACRESVQYRLAADPQYRLANDPQYRLANVSQYRMIPKGQQVASGDPRIQTIPPARRPEPASKAARESRYSANIRTTAKAEGIEPELLHAVVAVESGFNPAARSDKGAVGLMQLMPGTAARYGVTNPRDPSQNLTAGARHLRYLLGKFDNDVKLALAAYNAGEQAVWQFGNQVPPYPETRAYVRRVLASYHQHLLSSLLPESL